MRIGSIVYNTEYITGSTHGYKPGNLFVVAAQHESGGLYAYPVEPTGVLYGTKIELEINTFHRADKELEHVVQTGYELEGTLENYCKQLPNPNKANIDKLAAEIHAGLGGIVDEEDEEVDGLEEEGDDDEDEEEDEEEPNF